MPIKQGYVFRDGSEEQWRVNKLYRHPEKPTVPVADLECLAGGHVRMELVSEVDRWYIVSR